MKIKPRRIVFVKLTAAAAAALLAVFGLSDFSARFGKTRASSSGPSPSHTGAPLEANCTSCHASFALNSGAGAVSIAKLPVNYLPGQSIPVTVTVNQADAVIFGFQLTAIDSQGRRVGNYTLPAQPANQLQTKTGIVDGNQRLYVEHTTDGVIPTQFGTKSWTFMWNPPATRAGKVSFYAVGNAANSDGSPAGDYIYTTAASVLSGSAISNFDGDGKSDVAVFRPSSGEWYNLQSGGDAFQTVRFGLSGDKPVAGDFDGDGRSDRAVYRPSNGVWYVARSSDATFQYVRFGLATDTPVIGDFDGDGKTDFVLYRPGTGVWFLMQSAQGFAATQFGVETDQVASGDYDGDGRTDIAVYRPQTGVWFLNRSRDGYLAIQFGAPSDKSVPADYDGDGRTDIAVYRPADGLWFVRRSSGASSVIKFGVATDKPVPADYDGDGRADIAVYRPSEGNWYILYSSDNSYNVTRFGTSEDVPAPRGFVAE